MPHRLISQAVPGFTPQDVHALGETLASAGVLCAAWAACGVAWGTFERAGVDDSAVLRRTAATLVCATPLWLCFESAATARLHVGAGLPDFAGIAATMLAVRLVEFSFPR
jgi:hypothetical protein